MSDWDEFATLCKTEFSGCTFTEELISLCDGKEDIAWVVYRHNLDSSLDWMQSNIPALGGKSPKKCLRDNLKNLKQVLLTFPCK